MKTPIPGISGILKFLFWFLTFSLSSLLVYHILSFYSFDAGLFFFRDRERNRENLIWQIAVYLHVTSGMLCLLSAVPLFFRTVLKNFPGLHIAMGKIYVIAVLTGLVPSGLYLSFFSDATLCLGMLAEVRFLLLGAGLFYCTLKAYTTIRKKQNEAHCRWMIRSYALAIVTLTFRSFVVINASIFNLERSNNVLLSLWVSLLFNFLVAETVINWKKILRKLPIINYSR